MKLDKLLQQRQDIWKGQDASRVQRDAISSGFSALDDVLTGGGWPTGALTELLLETPATAALSLLMPLLSCLSQTKKWIVLLDPPFIPYAPAWSAHGIDLSRILVVNSKNIGQRYWALEQALRSPSCSLILSWQPAFDHARLRRLQLAAEQSSSMGILIRPADYAEQASAAVLRIKLAAIYQGVNVHVIKRQAGWAVKAFDLPLAVPALH